MKGWAVGLRVVLGLAAACVVALAAGPAAAQLPTTLIVTVADSPDPAASGGQVVYTVTVKNDGTFKAHGVVVTIPIPVGTQFVKCTNNATVPVPCTCAPGIPCTPADTGTVTVVLGNIRAHLEGRVSLTLKMPNVASGTATVRVEARADGDDATDDRNHADTTVLAPGGFVTYQPSGRVGPITCGDTLSPDSFGDDTTAVLSGPIACVSGPYGLKITADGKTLDLNKFKIFWSGALTAGTVGILVSSANDVTIVGGSTNGTSGIEDFDWCVKDEGKSVRLAVDGLRCFRARSAGIDIATKKSLITNVKVDKIAGKVADPPTTAELPGGIGIHLSGDKARVKNSIVLRTSTVGIWLDGIDVNADGKVGSIEASTTTTFVDLSGSGSGGIGILLDNGPHSVKGGKIQGDGIAGDGKDGVVVGPTGTGNVIDSLGVKQFGANAIVDEGTGTTISTCNIDGVTLDAIVSSGPGVTISGNKVKNVRHGYVVSGADAEVDTNSADSVISGDGYVVSADNAVLTGNQANGALGRGFVLSGGSALFDTNVAELNRGDGIVVAGSGNTIKNSQSKSSGKNSAVPGVGIKVTGTSNHFNSNKTELSTGNEWEIAAGNIDDGSNKANGTPIFFDATGGNFN